MAVKFLSDEWLKAMQEKLKVEFSKKGLISTTFVQVVEGIPDGSDDVFISAELKKSMYVNYETGTIDDLPEDAPFKVFGDYEVYKGIIEGRIDGSKCLITGELTLEGNMAQALAMIGTYKKLEKCQRSIETEFHN